jgi:hypothetical protein
VAKNWNTDCAIYTISECPANCTGDGAPPNATTTITAALGEVGVGRCYWKEYEGNITDDVFLEFFLAEFPIQEGAASLVQLNNNTWQLKVILQANLEDLTEENKTSIHQAIAASLSANVSDVLITFQPGSVVVVATVTNVPEGGIGALCEEDEQEPQEEQEEQESEDEILRTNVYSFSTSDDILTLCNECGCTKSTPDSRNRLKGAHRNNGWVWIIPEESEEEISASDGTFVITATAIQFRSSGSVTFIDLGWPCCFPQCCEEIPHLHYHHTKYGELVDTGL